MASCPRLMGGGRLLELRSLGNSRPKEGASRPREEVSPSRSAAGGVKGRRTWSSEQLVDGELRRWLRSPSLLLYSESVLSRKLSSWVFFLWTLVGVGVVLSLRFILE